MFGWFRRNGGLIARASSTDAAATIQQYGTGKILSLKDGDTEVFSVDDGGAVASSATETITKAGIGTTSTDGLALVNTTDAAAGAQQYSPRLRLRGEGWKTDATAASQTVDFALEAQPVQGTSAPTGNFVLKASINGGAYSTAATLTSAGALSVAKITSTGSDENIFTGQITASGIVQVGNRLTFDDGGAVRNSGDTRIEFVNSGASAYIDGRALGWHANGPTSGIGYITGAGGTVTQGSGSGKATAVTLSTVTGAITMDAAELAAATAVSFTLTNTAIAAADVLQINITGGTAGAYTWAANCAAGSATITIRNVTAGALSEAVVLKFVLMKGATA